MMQFEIGDRVVCTVNHPDDNKHIVVGSTGTVCALQTRVGVCWDDDVGGHQCGSEYCPEGHGWWIIRSGIKLSKEDDIEIDEEKFVKVNSE